MSLTIGNGPLATPPPGDVNYRIDGPAHRLLLTPFQRRVRAEFAGTTVLDTVEGVLLHESNLLPVLYVPEADVRGDLLTPTDHTTHCPFKGDATYWSIVVGDQISANAVWGYADPLAEAPWLRGRLACYWKRLDRWLDEDEEVFGHLRDPFHRVDARTTSRSVRVLGAGSVLAESERPVVVSETGLPNRWYLPVDDVRTEVLERSSTTTHCPYKGQSTYWNLVADGSTGLDDIAWSYDEPFDDVRRVAGHICFDDERVTVEVT